jgi:hypothetical protein
VCSKSATFRVATDAPATRAIAAICASESVIREFFTPTPDELRWVWHRAHVRSLHNWIQTPEPKDSMRSDHLEWCRLKESPTRTAEASTHAAVAV